MIINQSGVGDFYKNEAQQNFPHILEFFNIKLQKSFIRNLCSSVKSVVPFLPNVLVRICCFCPFDY